ncbi:class I SAM-dependent methyltransferase [Polynucleobacter paneuropaeus]|nr:class I SAM-dependent methyltransferase [Polynucleobacter paneuropaeus]
MYQVPSKNEVTQFINDYHKIYSDKFKVFAYSRIVQLTALNQLIQSHKLINQKHIGVISGAISEPELALFRSEKITNCAYEEDKIYDLDNSWLEWPSKNFSLTICNHTFEHIFNPFVAVKNIIHHTAIGGYIFLSMPVVDCVHGEPHFYYSGFHPRFLERLAKENNLEILSLGAWGNHKVMVNSLHGAWLTEQDCRRGLGLFDLANPKAMYRKLIQNFRQIPFIFEDGQINSHKYMTNTWALLRKSS